MTEKQYAPSAQEKKVSNKSSQISPSEKVTGKKIEKKNLAVPKVENKKSEEKVEENKMEDKKEEKVDEKKDKKKKVEVKIAPKEFAFAQMPSARASPKNCVDIGKMIRGKSPERAIEMLEQVVKMKKAVPMRNREVGHRKGGLSGGRYPINSSKIFVDLLKSVSANATVNQIENPRITIVRCNKAPRPFRSGGRQGKRVHLYIEVRNKINMADENKNGGKK